jgi:hypothetical protein
MPIWKNQIILFLAAVKMHKNNTFKSFHVLQKKLILTIDFYAFRRGFRFEGSQQPSVPPTVEEEVKIRGDGDACAYYFWSGLSFYFRGCIFSHVRPFYERAVSNLDP